MQQIRSIYKFLIHYYGLDKKRLTLWLPEGDPRNSCVLTSEMDQKIDFNLIYYINSKEKANLSIFAHEMGHILFLEKYCDENGLDKTLSLLNNYYYQVENLKKQMTQNKNDLTNTYQSLFLEKEADRKAQEIETLLFREGYYYGR